MLDTPSGHHMDEFVSAARQMGRYANSLQWRSGRPSGMAKLRTAFSQSNFYTAPDV